MFKLQRLDDLMDSLAYDVANGDTCADVYKSYVDDVERIKEKIDDLIFELENYC